MCKYCASALIECRWHPVEYVVKSSETANPSPLKIVTDAVRGLDFRRATFSGPARGVSSCPWIRITIRPVELRGQNYYQFSFFDAKKHVAKNFTQDEVEEKVKEIAGMGFARIHVAAGAEEIDIHTTKKGKVVIGRKRVDAAGLDLDRAHNRRKEVPLPEGKADSLLQAMGILTRSGQVRSSMRAKYTQINEFLKHLKHVLDDAQLELLGREITILDCGCGSSFLTLAVHHYLNDILGMPAHIMGVDINEEVIRKSIERSQHVTGRKLSFACQRIREIDAKPDIVLALHACDTATDDAIALAISSGAKILLSVPCCHHHLNSMLRPVGQTGVLRPLLRHGILQERTADIITDALRALILRIMGYRTEVVEFVSPEHTARNLMIRAVRGVPGGDAVFVREYLDLRRFMQVTPYLEGALGQPFLRLLKDCEPAEYEG